MDNIKEKQSGSILLGIRDLVCTIQDRAAQVQGLGYIVEDTQAGCDYPGARAGLGAGIRLLMEDVERMTAEIDAGVMELRERWLPASGAPEAEFTHRQGDAQ